MIFELIFWILFLVCIYAYFGYPVILLLMSVFHQKTVNKDDRYTPSITFIVAAYNEEDVIGKKLDNLTSQIYDDEKIEIIIASDGSTDATEDIVLNRIGRDARIKLLALSRKGKANALNEAAEVATGDILIFTDANAMLDAHAARFLVASFSDSEVGCVAGNQHYSRSEKTSGSGLGEILYWRYDRWIKDVETRVGNAISADGALYAVRRKLFIPITDPAATDDFFISTRVVLQGYRLVYESRAEVVEATAGTSTREFKRKARIINRGLRSLFGLGDFLLPWVGGFYSIQLISHKLLRRLVPALLPFLLLVNTMIWSVSGFYFFSLILQVVVYMLGIVGFMLSGNTRWGKIRILYIPYYFCQANVAGLLGLIWFIQGQQISFWSPQREEA